MTQIIVNGENISQLGIPIEGEIQSLLIKTVFGLPTPIDKRYIKQVTDWIYDIAMRAETVWYNGVLIEKDSIKKWGE